MRARQLWATTLALPRLVTPAPLAWMAGAGLVVVAVGSNPASMVLHCRMAATLVAAAAAGLLDDTAAFTLAPSPTTLLARRSFRVAVLGVLVAAWWSAMLVVAAARRGAHLPALAVTREVMVLVAVSVVGALAVQRRGGDGGSGAVGGLFAIGWFALSFLPRSAWLPSPPDPLDPGAATPLSVVLLVAAVATVALSRDQAAGARGSVLAARSGD